jgi:MEDS: MEthanogen/methylotroph, DcmR Sensory domain
MKIVARHQCLIYEGSPSRNLPAVAAVVRQKLNENFRCLYLNSPVMVAGMRCYLAAAGIDIAHELQKTSLVLSSDQHHLVKGSFDVDQMMHTLEDALGQAVKDGYDGLWASGDMTWELGPRKEFSKLLEYEWRLEEFFQSHPALGGICQYHADTLPVKVLRQGLLAHPSVFVNETLSRINPHYLSADLFSDQAAMNPELESVINHLCHCEDTGTLAIQVAKDNSVA